MPCNDRSCSSSKKVPLLILVGLLVLLMFAGFSRFPVTPVAPHEPLESLQHKFLKPIHLQRVGVIRFYRK